MQINSVRAQLYTSSRAADYAGETELGHTEHFFLSLCLTQQFSIAGYDSHNFTRADGLGGAIAIFVEQEWLSSAVITSFSSAESLAVGLQNPLFDFALLAFYLPPYQNVCLFIKDLKPFHLPAARICMAGDRNGDLLKTKKHFLNTLADVGVEAAINLPTRIELLRDKLPAGSE